MYDLDADPGEMNNLYQDEEYHELAKQMRERIIQWAEETGHRYSELIKQKHLSES